MDFIHGLPIDEYCRERHVPLKERLALFRTLCSAVQYVHQRLMVHGDLKCSNVLVTQDGALRLLDFGVARLMVPMGAQGRAEPLGPVALTPEYASPEQIRGELVTTASDVYSLGVMLYRLLSGRLPYGGPDVLPHELAEIICAREPMPPSQAARECGAPVVARHWPQIAGDLDCITGLALRKRPGDRYSSVERLSEDLQLHLEGFPVHARAATLPYRLGRFWGRHRAGIATGVLLVLLLIGGFVTAAWQAHVARQERARAERHFTEVRRLAQTFLFDVHQSIQNLPGATPARHMLVVNSLQYLDTLAAEAGDDPSLQRDLAMAYEKVGDVQGGYRSANLGDYSGAIASYRRALQIRLALLGVPGTDLELRRELLTNYGKLSETLAGAHDMPGAVLSSRAALRYGEELAAMPGSTVTDRRNLGNVYLSLGWQMAKSGQVERGLLLMNQGTALYETLLDADANDTRSRHNAAVAYGRMGEVLIGIRKNAAALRVHHKQLELVQALEARDPRSADLQTIESYAQLGIATVLARQGALQDALEKQVQAMHILRALFDADAKDEEARYNAAFATSEVAETSLVLGQSDRAERNTQDALAILEPAPGLTATAVNATKVLQAVNLVRMGRISSAHAARATAGRDRSARCAQARRWFELGLPIIAMAQHEGQWPPDAGDPAAEAARNPGRCHAG
jgi:eukaryotic-like serine/threonine-protein kinase